jgi:hypothetical protein
MHILRILCNNGSLVTWKVVSLTAAKFKLLYFMSRFALSYAANMFILMILYDFCLFPAQFCYIIVYIRKVESRVHLSIIFPLPLRSCKLTFQRPVWGYQRGDYEVYCLPGSVVWQMFDVVEFSKKKKKKKVPPKRLNTSARWCQIPENGYLSFPKKLPHQNSVCFYVLAYRTQMSNPI